jgi:AcrR family transcriptional regulator
MRTIPFVRWIANAAARLAGPHGAVTRRAREADCSRQSVYNHARKVKAAVEGEHGGGPTRAELLQERDSLRRENTQLWDWLFQTIEFPPAKQQEFAVTAMAMGLSHSQIRALLAILQGARASPGRSTIHRWVQAAGKAAGEILKHLDESCKELVRVGCLDEIFFHRRPVLVGVEPKSMVWFLGSKSNDRQASTWFSRLQPWTWLSYVVSDAGGGLRAGIARLQRHQRANGQPVLERGLDVFHIKKEAQQALNILWGRVEQAWKRAEAAGRALKRARWQGRSERRLTQQVQEAWTKAFEAFKLYERRETAWKRVEPALDVFRPDGRLNDRAWAHERVAWALPRLPGSAWSKLRRLLQNSEAFTFLDRLHHQLAQLSLPEALRDVLVHLWWLRRQRPGRSSETAVGGYRHVAPLVQQILVQKMEPNWRHSYRQVAAVLSQAVRASSAVECMNSILRMHQSRHRTLTQGMLDVKRLYWNTRMFRGGQRKGCCPYEHLGLKLPSYDFWSLLHPAMDAALAEAKANARSKANTQTAAA